MVDWIVDWAAGCKFDRGLGIELYTGDLILWIRLDCGMVGIVYWILD